MLAPLVTAALISGGTQLGGALMGKHGQKSAAKEATKANESALAYQREQLAEEKRQFEVQEAARKAEWERQFAAEQESMAASKAAASARDARRAPYRAASAGIAAQTAARIGLGNLSAYSGGGGSTQTAPAPSGASASADPALTLATMGGYNEPAPQEIPVNQRTFGNLRDWNKWRTA